MAFRSGVARAGHFGIEFDLRKISDKDKARLAQSIADYKQSRDLIHHGRCWTGDAADGLSWHAFGDPTDLMVQVLRVSAPSFRFPPPLRLPMVHRDRNYLIDINGQPGTSMQGGWIARSGLPLPRMNAETALWIILKAE